VARKGKRGGKNARDRWLESGREVVRMLEIGG